MKSIFVCVNDLKFVCFQNFAYLSNYQHVHLFSASINTFNGSLECLKMHLHNHLWLYRCSGVHTYLMFWALLNLYFVFKICNWRKEIGQLSQIILFFFKAKINDVVTDKSPSRFLLIDLQNSQVSHNSYLLHLLVGIIAPSLCRT